MKTYPDTLMQQYSLRAKKDDVVMLGGKVIMRARSCGKACKDRGKEPQHCKMPSQIKNSVVETSRFVK